MCIRDSGWTFCPVDILDEEGTAMFPIRGGKWFDEMSVGGHLTNYDSFLAPVSYTHLDVYKRQAMVWVRPWTPAPYRPTVISFLSLSR